MPEANARYEPQNYWSHVAEQIRTRSGRDDVAGTDDPYFRHKRAKFLRRFLARLDVCNRVVPEIEDLMRMEFERVKK